MRHPSTPESASTMRLVAAGTTFTELPLIPYAGIGDNIGREDDRAGDGRGYERDETDQFHQIVQRLVDDGDARAQAAGRQARRTLAAMAPGHARQPVLRLTRPLTFRPADDACVLCGYWTCRCGTAQTTQLAVTV